ncbi:VOC family protein [Micrococcaceae bacterium RIT802]|nr:VOC family protein [Micrococcaceae bacterium RIT 802]
MRLENIIWDAANPRSLGSFWATALGAETITDEPEGYEARLDFGEGFFLDLGFQQVDPIADSLPRLHLDLTAGGDQTRTVERLLSLGARHEDIGQGDVPWVVLADPEGNAFCVMPEGKYDDAAGPIGSLPLDSADPGRDSHFWANISGWDVAADGQSRLRHRSGMGPTLELCPEPRRKVGKNNIHLDVRADSGDIDPIGSASRWGARLLEDQPELAWVVMADPSGNEFCVLDAPSPVKSEACTR